MAENTLSFEVELAIPPRPEFVGVARLSIARVASLMSFSFDDVEDIRLAVGEACTRAIERMGAGGETAALIRVPCRGYEDRLAIEVHSPLTQPGAKGDAADEDLGSMLVQILMDDLTEEDRPDEGIHVVQMVKFLTQ